jgi:Lon protease-like protein
MLEAQSQPFRAARMPWIELHNHQEMKVAVESLLQGPAATKAALLDHLIIKLDHKHQRIEFKKASK